MTTAYLIPTVTLVDGQPRVSSLDITEKFGKPHKDVLAAIRKLMNDLPNEFIERNFSPSEYTDSTGRKLPMFSLTRDGFSLLAMGFTGKRALEWKVKYIEAFNAMEKELLKKPAPALESEEERKRRLARERLRRHRERKREQLALLPAPKPYREKCAEVVAEMHALHGQFFRVSENMMLTFMEPFWETTISPVPEHMKPFADAMRTAIQSFWMAMFKDFATLEDLYRAYVEAEKVLNG